MAVFGMLTYRKKFSFEIILHKSTFPESPRLSKSTVL